MSLDDLSFIPTKGSTLKKNSQVEFQSVIYQSHKPKAKSIDEKLLKRRIEPEVVNTINFEKTKYDIFKFATSNSDIQKKEEAKVQLAIKLGAKPPKNKYKNYKLLLEEKKQEKERTKLLSNFQQLDKNSLENFTAERKSFNRKRRKQQGLLDDYGKVKVKK